MRCLSRCSGPIFNGRPKLIRSQSKVVLPDTHALKVVGYFMRVGFMKMKWFEISLKQIEDINEPLPFIPS